MSHSIQAPVAVEPGFDAIRELLRARTQLDLEAFRRSYVLRRLAVRVRRTGAGGLEEYAELLRRDEHEMERLLDALTLQVTMFFRDPSLFEALERRVLPERLNRRRGRLRLLSAGCATGQEPWSLAILTAEFLRKRRLELPLSVRGFDVDKKAVARARRGVYPDSALEGLDPSLRQRYFDRHGDANSVGRELRHRVRFAVGDLCQPLPFRDQDVVLCRNVLIYITADLHTPVIEGLAGTLAEGGYLVLGAAERLPEAVRGYFTVVDSRERIYRLLRQAPPARPEDP